MAQYQIPHPDDHLQCPYDTSHNNVSAKSMQRHLMRCRKNNPGKNFASCPFNAKHEMPHPELRYHIMKCPDKALLEPELRHNALRSSGENVLKGCTDMPERRDFDIACSEDWDAEAADPVLVGVNPASYSRVRFKDLNGLTKTTPVAMAAVRNMKPKPQPTSAVFAYSIGRGRGQPATSGNYGDGPTEKELWTRQMARNPIEEAPLTAVCDRSRGRGLRGGRGPAPQMAQTPPPGFLGRGRALNLMIDGGPPDFA